MAEKKSTNRAARKKRNEEIYATTVGDVTEITVHFNALTGEVSFGGEMTNVYSERSYDRPKGPKVLSRVPQSDQKISFDAGPALKKNFDFICAVDTNTRVIQGKRVSVVAVVTVKSITLPERDGLKSYWKHDVPFCIEYVELSQNPENFGWIAAIQLLKARKFIDDSMRVGMIVDSDLGKLRSYNERKEPVGLGLYLPANIQLVYATSDAGKESIVNVSLGLADSAASQCLAKLEAGAIPFNERLANNPYFERDRIIGVDVVEQRSGRA